MGPPGNPVRRVSDPKRPSERLQRPYYCLVLELLPVELDYVKKDFTLGALILPLYVRKTRGYSEDNAYVRSWRGMPAAENGSTGGGGESIIQEARQTPLKEVSLWQEQERKRAYPPQHRNSSKQTQT